MSAIKYSVKMDTKENLERTFGNLFDAQKGASCGEGGCSIKKPAPQLSFAQQLKQKYSFHNVHNNIMQGIMNHIISWILSCFNKYDEQTFHKKMKEPFHYRDRVSGEIHIVKGFDFISDWNRNHPSRYLTIIKIIRKTGAKLDKKELHDSVLKTISNHGWTISDEEKYCFWFTVSRLYNILYNNTDSIVDFGN
jgi:hypothetical protein